MLFFASNKAFFALDVGEKEGIKICHFELLFAETACSHNLLCINVLYYWDI